MGDVCENMGAVPFVHTAVSVDHQSMWSQLEAETSFKINNGVRGPRLGRHGCQAEWWDDGGCRLGVCRGARAK
eukprot:SAG31_NODE_38616_length_294_cov_28.307692_1_plen_72_part_10